MEDRDEFVNRTQGYVGYIRIDRKGDERSEALESGARVFLTEEEQVLTARAHRRPEDSPFVTRTIVHFDPQTGEATDTFEAALLEKVKPESNKREQSTAERRKAPADEPEPRKRSTSSRRKASTRAAT